MLPTQVLSCTPKESSLNSVDDYCCAGTHAEALPIVVDWQGIGSPGDICAACEKGKFVPYERDGKGLSVEGIGVMDKWYGCWWCPDGTYQNEIGSTGCKVCPAGYESDFERRWCDECDDGYNSYAGGICGSRGGTCGEGKYSAPGSHGCLDCPIGRYGPNSENIYWISYNGTESRYKIPANSQLAGCYLCPKGRYQDQTGQQVCRVCPMGKYNDDTVGAQSSSICKDCPEGKTLIPHINGLSLQGHILARDVSRCNTCTAGKFWHINNQECYDCPLGSYTDDDGHLRCKDCPEGKISAPGDGTLGSTACIECGVGKYGKDGICVECEEGKYKDISDSSCVDCPTGNSSIGFSDWEKKYYIDTTDDVSNPRATCHKFCSCDNGIGEINCANPSDKCIACFPGYSLVGDQCVQNQCTCSNGLAAYGSDCPRPGVEHCVGCHIGSVPREVNKTDPADPEKNITLTECRQVDHTCTCANGNTTADTCSPTSSLRCCPANNTETCGSCNAGYFLSDQRLDEQYYFANNGYCEHTETWKIDNIGKNDTQACAKACSNTERVPHAKGFVINPLVDDTCWCEAASSKTCVFMGNDYKRYDFIDTEVAITSKCVSCPENTEQSSDMFSGNQCGCASGSKPRLEDLERSNLREVLEEVCAKGKICYSISGDIYTTGETYPLFTRISPYRPTFGDMLWFYFGSGDYMRVVATDFSGNVIKTFSQIDKTNVAQITETEFDNPTRTQTNRECVDTNGVCIRYIDLNHCSSSCAAGKHKEYSVVGGKLQEECVSNVCTCNTGAPATGEDCPVHGSVICEKNCNTDQIREFTWLNAPAILSISFLRDFHCPDKQLCHLYEGRFYYHDGTTLLMSDLQSPFRIGANFFFYYVSTEGLYVASVDRNGGAGSGAFISKDKFTDGEPRIAELTYEMYDDAPKQTQDIYNNIRNAAFEKKYCVADLRVKKGAYSCRGKECKCTGGEPAQGENCTNDGQYHCTGCDDPNEEPSKVSWQDDNGLDITTCRPKCNATSHRDEFGYNCEVNVCQCSNGGKDESALCDEHGKEVCESCDKGYALVDGVCVDCLADKNGKVCTDNRVLYGGECLRLFRDASSEDLVNAFQNTTCDQQSGGHPGTCETGYSLLGNDCVRDKCFKEDGYFKCGAGKVSVDGACLRVLDKMSADEIAQKYREQGSCN